MNAEYDLVRRPAAKGTGEAQPFYPRIVSKGTILSKRLVQDIAEESSFSPGDIEGLLVAIERKISNYLIAGHHVQLGGIGYFSAKLKARPVMDKKEIRSPSIYFDNVNFRASMRFRKNSRGFVERATMGFNHSLQIPEETRRKRMEEFLDNNPFMTRHDYSYMSGLLKNKALEELNRLVDEGILDTKGAGSHKVYVRAHKKQPEMQ